jgi:hypothetical protein
VNHGTSPQWGELLQSQDPTTVSDNCTVTVQISAVANPAVILDSATVSFNLWTGP